jgi:heterokaryon incompatibility protein (HET)
LGDEIPNYVILSHTWEEEEAIFEDMKGGTASTRKGFSKLKSACDQAVRDGYDWIWIDTCCIDKSSSAELQESINSMFEWYQKSNICYVYLADIQASAVWGPQGKVAPDGPKNEVDRELKVPTSRWWTRGWTLRKQNLDSKW